MFNATCFYRVLSSLYQALFQEENNLYRWNWTSSGERQWSGDKRSEEKSSRIKGSFKSRILESSLQEVAHLQSWQRKSLRNGQSLPRGEKGLVWTWVFISHEWDAPRGSRIKGVPCPGLSFKRWKEGVDVWVSEQRPVWRLCSDPAEGIVSGTHVTEEKWSETRKPWRQCP